MYRNLMIVLLLCGGVGCSAGAQVPAASKPSAGRILVLEMKLSGTQHQITGSRIVESTAPLKPARDAGPTAFAYTVLDKDDHLLASGSFDDPRIVRGVMPPAGEPQTGHPVVVADSVSYVLRVPYSSSARFLKVSSPRNVDPRTSGVQKPAEPDQTIDLAPFVGN